MSDLVSMIIVPIAAVLAPATEINFQPGGSVVPCIQVEGKPGMQSGYLFEPTGCTGYTVSGLRATSQCGGIAPSVVVRSNGQLEWARVRIGATVFKATTLGTLESSVLSQASIVN